MAEEEAELCRSPVVGGTSERDGRKAACRSDGLGDAPSDAPGRLGSGGPGGPAPVEADIVTVGGACGGCMTVGGGKGAGCALATATWCCIGEWVAVAMCILCAALVSTTF